jgi:hypothetical protein
MNKHIQHKFDCLMGHLTTDKQKEAYRNLLSVVHSELMKLEAKVERLSGQEIKTDGELPISVVEAVSNVTRLTFAPGERVSLKIPGKTTSEKIRADYLKIAEYVRDNYQGCHTIRGSIKWDDEQKSYSIGFQTVKGRARKTFGLKYKEGVFIGGFDKTEDLKNENKSIHD